MMKALVIGGSGPVGPHIVDGLLRRGYEVTILHRGVHEVELPSEVEHLHFDPHWAESLAEGLRGRSYDIIVASYGRLQVIVDAVKGHTPRLISVGAIGPIYKGLSKVSDPHPWQTMEEMPLLLQEDHPLATVPDVDRFSEQVRLAERMVMAAHKDRYYSATHFRYPYVYGARHLGPLEWSIVRRIRDGRTEVVVPGGGMAILSRGYTENLAHAVLLAVDNPRASGGQIYNISDERTFSTREWIRMIAKAMDSELRFIEIPFNLLSADYTGAPWQALFPFHQVVDISKVMTQIGYRDLVPSERGLELTVQWLMEHPLSPGGEEEQRMDDSFDYAAEDQMIEIWETASERLRKQFREVPHRSSTHRHAYAHPKKVGDLK